MRESSKYLSRLYSKKKPVPNQADPAPPEKPASRLLNMSLLNLVGNGIRVAVSFITAVFASRWLGAEGYGTFNLIFGYTAFLNYFFTLGFDHSLTYYINRYSQEGRPDMSRSVLRVALTLSLIIGIVVILLLLLVLPNQLGPARADRFLVPALVMVAQTLFWAIGSILAGYLRAYKAFLPTILREQILFPVAHLVLLAITVLLWSYGVTGYAVGYALATLLSTMFVAYHSYKLFSEQAAIQVRAQKETDVPWFGWLRFSLPIGLTVALEPLLIWSCIIAAGWYVNVDEIGHLAVANRLTIFVQFLFIAVTPIFTPYLAEYLYRPEELKREYQKVVLWCAKWALLFSFVLLTAGDYVLKLFGSDYSEALLSLALILPGSIAEACFGVAKYGLVLAGKNRINVLNQIVGLAIGFGGSILLAPRWGAPGVALALSTAMLTVNCVRVVAFYHFFRVSPLSRHHIGSILVAVLPLAGLCWVTYEMGMRGSQRLIAAVLAFVVGFALSFWSERQKIIGLIRPRLGRMGIGSSDLT